VSDSPTPLTPNAVPGFFRSLFDFRFTSFVTRKIAGFIYAILLISVVMTGIIAFLSTAIAGISMMTGPFNAQPIQGILTILAALVFVPIGTILGVVLARVLVEVNVALVAIAENTASLRGK
jgi:hypothetical protein